MSLNAHKALQLFYTKTRSQLQLNDIIHRTEVVPEDWGSIKNTVVPANLMTYFAFDYNDYGVGISLFDATKDIGTQRALL